MLRSFGPRRDKVIGVGENCVKSGLYNLCPSSNITTSRMIKSKRMMG
jgi:hypothetical protein